MKQTVPDRTRVVLLAHGPDPRMNSNVPKVLHELHGRTILGRLITVSDDLNPEHIHIVTGHKDKKIEEFIQKNPPTAPASTHLQEQQLGTGHALTQLSANLQGFTGNLVVLAADTPLVTGAALAALVDLHKNSNAFVSFLTANVDDTKNYGRILRDESGYVTEIVQYKDATEAQCAIKEVNSAIYCFAWPQVENALSALKEGNPQNGYCLTDVIGWAHKYTQKIESSKVSDWREIFSINSRLELAEATRLMSDITIDKLSFDSGVTIVDRQTTLIAPEVKIGNGTVIMPGCCLTGEIEIGQNCTIGPNTVMENSVRVGDNSLITQSLVNSCDIGSNCTIGPFSHLKEGTVLADRVKVGNFVEIKKSIINSKTNASHLSYIGDSTLGSGVNIGAGTITANYDHITKRKARTTICDGASTGCNSVLVAPLTLEDASVVAAGSVITKTVPRDALAIARPEQRNVEGWAESRLMKATTAKLEATNNV